MSETEERNLESAQNEQKRVGDAGSNPKTSGPSENLRERAAELNESDQDSREPA